MEERKFGRRDLFEILTGVVLGASGVLIYKSISERNEKSKIPTQEELKEYTRITNKNIEQKLQKLPEIWGEILKTDYTTSSNDYQIQLRRKLVKDPRSILLELGMYYPDSQKVAIPSIWNPGDQKTRFDLISQISEAIPHELGHALHLSLMKNPAYEGPSEKIINYVFEKKAIELKEKYELEFLKSLEAKIVFPELDIHQKLVTSGISSLDGFRWSLREASDDVFYHKNTNDDANFRAKKLLSQAEDYIKNISERMTIANDVLASFVDDHSIPREEILKVCTKEFYDTLIEGLRYVKNTTNEIEKIEKKLPKSNYIRVRSMNLDSFVHNLPPYETVYKYKDALISAIRLLGPVKPDERKVLLIQAKDRFSIKEVFANTVGAVMNNVKKDANQERFVPSEEMLDVLSSMRYEGSSLLAPCIEEYSNRKNWFGQSNKNKINIKGIIPYL